MHWELAGQNLLDQGSSIIVKPRLNMGSSNYANPDVMVLAEKQIETLDYLFESRADPGSGTINLLH